MCQFNDHDHPDFVHQVLYGLYRPTLMGETLITFYGDQFFTVSEEGLALWTDYLKGKLEESRTGFVKASFEAFLLSLPYEKKILFHH